MRVGKATLRRFVEWLALASLAAAVARSAMGLRGSKREARRRLARQLAEVAPGLGRMVEASCESCGSSPEGAACDRCRERREMWGPPGGEGGAPAIQGGRARTRRTPLKRKRH